MAQDFIIGGGQPGNGPQAGTHQTPDNALQGSTTPGTTPRTAAPGGDLIKDSSQTAFAKDVIEASMQVPVIVDFWAPWCGPCKQLTPAIEKAVRDAKGAVRLVKINVDENQMLAGQLQIQSIPTVYAFFQGQPVDGFMGAQPESQLKEFINRLIAQAGGAPGGDPVAEALDVAEKALAAGQFAEAGKIFAQILQRDPANVRAAAGIITARLELGDAQGAKTMFEQLPEEVRTAPEFASLSAKLKLATEPPVDESEIAGLMEKIAHNAGDHQARFDLAMALHGAGKREAAARELLSILEKKRDWQDGKAKSQLFEFFEAWGPKDPLTAEMRRELSSLLFS